MTAETLLETAERHVFEGELAIATQRGIIDYMAVKRQDMRVAEELLRNMEDSLRLMYERLSRERQKSD